MKDLERVKIVTRAQKIHMYLNIFILRFSVEFETATVLLLKFLRFKQAVMMYMYLNIFILRFSVEFETKKLN